MASTYKLSFDSPDCPDAKPTDPASYCPATNTISVDLPKLQEMSRPTGFAEKMLIAGDNTALAMVVSRYALALQKERGAPLDTPVAALRSACLTGVGQRGMAQPGGDLVLTAGDLDEAVAGLLTSGLVASDVNGVKVPAGFTRITAFRAGETILTFDGPELTQGELQRRGDGRTYALPVAHDRYIDLVAPGRFVNHSCDPNAGIWQERLLVAIRPIAEGEQILFDYSTALDRNHRTTPCRCGSAKCRGVIGDFHRLPVPLQVHYLRLGIVPQFIVRECQRRIHGVTPTGQAPRGLRTHRAV